MADIVAACRHATLDAPSFGGAFAGVVTQRLPFAHGLAEDTMHGGNVIAVDAVFRLHLPIAPDNIGLLPRHHFQTVRGLIAQQIDKRPGGAKIILQILDLTIQAAKDETAIIANPGHGG